MKIPARRAESSFPSARTSPHIHAEPKQERVLPSRSRTECLVSGDARSWRDPAVTRTRRLAPNLSQAALSSAPVPASLFRNGSYTSPVTHSWCSRIASFRATATSALFLPFLPPRPPTSAPTASDPCPAPAGHDAVRPLHQQLPQIQIPFFGDPQLRFALPRNCCAVAATPHSSPRPGSFEIVPYLPSSA